MIFEILFKIKIVLVLKNGGKTTENQKYCYRDTGKKNCRIEEEEGRDKGRTKHHKSHHHRKMRMFWFGALVLILKHEKERKN